MILVRFCDIGATKSVVHLIAGCPFSSGFWHWSGIEIVEDDLANLWNMQPSYTFLLLISTLSSSFVVDVCGNVDTMLPSTHSLLAIIDYS
jgi:hypothetical protein